MKITKDDARKILGVKEDSTPDEIRSSYKRLALKWHPDKHGDSHVSKDEATHKFQEVSAAYKRLTTNANDHDDEIDDSEFMNIREMMELFAHIFFHNGVRGCPHHGMDCCDYEDDEYFYSDEEYYDYSEDESEDEFLDTIAHRLRNKYEARKYMTKDTIQTQRRVTEEEALRNARELIEEEELEKKREEKKKAKRKKKKEKKKLREKEKKDQEISETDRTTVIEDLEGKPNNNKENTNPEKTKLLNGHIFDEKPTSNKIMVDTKGSTANISNVTTAKSKKNKQNSNNNKKSNNKEKNKGTKDKQKSNSNHKNMDSDHDEESIDTNSAFFARAASKAPSILQTNLPPPTEQPKDVSNKKKKNKDNQSTKTSQNKKAKNKTTTETIDQNHKKSLKEEEKSEQPKSNINNVEKNKNQQNNNSSISDTQNNNKSTSSPPVNNLTRSCDSSNGSDVDVIILQSRQVAVQGNQMAQTGDYHGAVKMFSKAIQLDPSDFRFFGNRSYCYDRIEKYDNALKDADAAIRLASEWPKGYFRKGRALTGLKRFQEAEQVFQQVLKLDPVCEDAQFELARVRVQILIDMGFTQILSEQAVRTYGTVQQALEALLAGKVSDEEGSIDEDLSEADNNGESYLSQVIENNMQNKNNIQKTHTSSKQTEPKCTALWVGNVDPEMVTEKQMTQLFAKCGQVSSVRILPHKYCAFVNYVDTASAGAAMDKLQGAGLGNQKLLLRFPNNPPPGSHVPPEGAAPAPPPPAVTPIPITNNNKISPPATIIDESKVSGPVNGNECYFWRTTGCVFEQQCRYKHVRGHKGIDLSKVQAKYGKIPTN